MSTEFEPKVSPEQQEMMRDFFILRRKSKGSSLVQMGVKAFFLGLADDALWFGSVKEITKESNLTKWLKTAVIKCRNEETQTNSEHP